MQGLLQLTPEQNHLSGSHKSPDRQEARVVCIVSGLADCEALGQTVKHQQLGLGLGLVLAFQGLPALLEVATAVVL